ncbi:sec23/Sec24 protein transport family protein [Wolffia australiana]
MQPSGTDKQGMPGFPSRPVSPFAASPPRSAAPFPSSGPVIELETSYNPLTSLPHQPPMPTSGPGIAHPVQSIGYGPPRPTATPDAVISGTLSPRQITTPSSPTQGPFYSSKTTAAYPRFSSPFAPIPPPVGAHPTVQTSSPPAMRPQPFQPSVPPSGPPQTYIPPYSSMPPRGNAPLPPMDSAFSATRPGHPSYLQPTPSSPFPPSHGGFVPPAPVSFPFSTGSKGAPAQPLGSVAPPTGALQNLYEEFQSMSIGSAAGSMDGGINLNSLPRPIDSGAESTSIADAYPQNCHPRYFRLTTSAIPNSQSLQSRWHLPIGAVVHPLADSPDGEQVPIVNFGSAGVIRCRRCRTYINPYATFADSGRKWRCNLCSLLNDVPPEYFCTLDVNGRRCDLDQRPELTKGSVEIVAPTEYMVRPPMPPIYFFLIDVSATAAHSGMLEIVANTIKSCLDEMPGSPRTQIGFITFDSTLHFYNLKSTLTQPQMMVVTDLDDLFIPLPDDLLVNLADSRNVIDVFLDSLSTMFQQNTNVESALGPGLRAAFMVLSQLGGKLIVFQSALPSLGVGRLKLRGDDLRVYGTDKEHLLRVPEDPFYKQMAAEFTKYQIGVDIFACSERYCDVASLGTLCKYTGGQLYHYPSFRGEVHHEKFKFDLSRNLTRETAWEAVMRIRCGKGVRFTSYHGNFMLRSTDLLALPSVDCDKAFGMQLSLEETLMTSQTVYFQVALLYTSSSGERRIRVHTAAAPVVTDLAEMYRHADVGATISLMSRLAIEKMQSNKLEEVRQSVQLRITKSLKEYRNLYAVQHRLGGRLIYPESLKLLPLYGLALCKSAALRGGHADVALDDRCSAGHNMMILPISRTLKLLYPTLIRVDEGLLKGGQSTEIPSALPLTKDVLDPSGLYVYDDGFRFILWFGRMLPSELMSSILGFDSSGFVDLSKVNLVEQNNGISRNLMGLLRRMREKDTSCHQLCMIVRQGEQPHEGLLFLSNLVEDQSFGISSYGDWILHIFRQTQQNP